MDSCIFCEIVAGRASASVVYKDELSLAFMDLTPVTKGHLLVVPKAHYRNIFDCPADLAGYLLSVATKLANPLQRATGCQGLNVYIANEPVAGQDVWHLHLHMLPRYEGDGFGLKLPAGYPRQGERSTLDQIAFEIREQLDENISKEGM